MKIFNANLEVTKATVQGGEIKELEINRQNVPLASSVKLEANKTVTITENGPVEITPTSGKDAMQKVTATVNVSGGGSGGVVTFYAWECTEEPNIGMIIYTLSLTPEVGSYAFEKGYNDGEVSSTTKYEIASVGENSITWLDDDEQQQTANRDSTEDVVYDSTSNG